jgi:hypothetical protein
MIGCGSSVVKVLARAGRHGERLVVVAIDRRIDLGDRQPVHRDLDAADRAGEAIVDVGVPARDVLVERLERDALGALLGRRARRRLARAHAVEVRQALEPRFLVVGEQREVRPRIDQLPVVRLARPRLEPELHRHVVRIGKQGRGVGEEPERLRQPVVVHQAEQVDEPDRDQAEAEPAWTWTRRDDHPARARVRFRRAADELCSAAFRRAGFDRFAWRLLRRCELFEDVELAVLALGVDHSAFRRTRSGLLVSGLFAHGSVPIAYATTM